MSLKTVRKDYKGTNEDIDLIKKYIMKYSATKKSKIFICKHILQMVIFSTYHIRKQQ